MAPPPANPADLDVTLQGSKNPKIPAGAVEHFQGTSKFVRWFVRLKGAFQIYGVSDPITQKNYMLHYLSGSVYDTLCDLMSPDQPEDQEIDTIVAALTEHYDPAPLEIAEYFNFHHRSQREKEPLKEYLADLRKLATHCGFGTFLNTALRNQFVVGLRCKAMRDRLLGMKNITLTRAYETAVSMERADLPQLLTDKSINKIHSFNNSSNYKSKRSNVPVNAQKSTYYSKGNEGDKENKTSTGGSDPTCFRCCGPHYATRCRHINSTCSFCRKKGHIQKACLKKKSNNNLNKPQQLKSKKVHQVDDDSDEDEVIYVNNCQEVVVKNHKCDKMMLDVQINKKTLSMEFDSGSAVSLITADTHKNLFSKLKLHDSKSKLKSYTGDQLKLLGVAEVTVTVENLERALPLFVVAGGAGNLFGREWISAYPFHCFEKLFKNQSKVEQIFLCNKSDSGDNEKQLNNLIKEFYKIFEPRIGVLKGEPLAINLKPDVSPIFRKARPVPHALKAEVESEIKHLVAQGVLEKVDSSAWATPLVVVPKANSARVRLCGDFRQTLNRYIVETKHPLPTIDELFENLAGCKVFSKIDLNCAYLQAPIRPEDQSLLVLNTHLGLFKCRRLWFGLNFAPCKWQEQIEKIFIGLPEVKVFLDDIRIATRDKTKHLQILREVLSRLANNGITVNKNKCIFMTDSIEYCGYRIDDKGVHKMQQKIDEFLDVSPPQNVSELRSILGFCNYYHRFFEHMSSHLEPLYNLLKKNKYQMALVA